MSLGSEKQPLKIKKIYNFSVFTMHQRNIERKSDWYVDVFLAALDQLPKWKESGNSGIAYWRDVFKTLPQGVEVDPESLERKFNRWRNRREAQKEGIEKKRAQKKKIAIPEGKQEQTNNSRMLSPIKERELGCAVKALTRCNLPLGRDMVIFIAQEMAGKSEPMKNAKRWYNSFCQRQNLHVRAMKGISYGRTNGTNIVPDTEQFITNLEKEVKDGGYVGKPTLTSAFAIEIF